MRIQKSPITLPVKFDIKWEVDDDGEPKSPRLASIGLYNAYVEGHKLPAELVEIISNIVWDLEDKISVPKYISPHRQRKLKAPKDVVEIVEVSEEEPTG